MKEMFLDSGSDAAWSEAGPWIAELAPPSVRENNCVVLLNVLDRHDGEAWFLGQIASEALIPETTARRLLFPEVIERRTLAWLQSFRSTNLSTMDSDSRSTGHLVQSYYGHLLANSTYLGIVNGVEMVRVNTSQFELFQRIGAKYDFDVTFDPTIRSAGHGAQGRARARYVGPTWQWNSEDRLDREGYRARWHE